MKNLYFLFVSIFLIIICSCKYGLKISNHLKSTETIKDTAKIIADEENAGIPIGYEEPPNIKTVYVTARNGIEIKQQPDVKSETIGKYEYGEKLDVIEENNNWLGVRDRITRKFKRGGSDFERSRWEKLYIQKSLTGNITDINVIDNDLYVISSITKNGKTEIFEDDKLLASYLKIELIDSNLYLNKKATSVDFLIADTTSTRKKNGVIELKCTKKNKLFIDKPDAEEYRQEFEYIGQIPMLNCYVIEGTYWESWNYIFIDKKRGKEMQSFIEYPFISADRKKIICIYDNVYDDSADLALYKIKNKKTELVINLSFKHWMPREGKEKMFWSTDGYFYMPITHTKVFMYDNENPNVKSQYLRIKVIEKQ